MSQSISNVAANPTDSFPGNHDAGKVLEWISRKISSTSLGTGLLSALEVERDAGKNRLQAPCRLEASL